MPLQNKLLNIILQQMKGGGEYNQETVNLKPNSRHHRAAAGTKIVSFSSGSQVQQFLLQQAVPVMFSCPLPLLSHYQYTTLWWRHWILDLEKSVSYLM